LLLDVTAFLSTSATFDYVAEAFSVPAHSATAIVAPATLGAQQTAWALALDASSAATDVPTSDDPQFVPEQPRPGTLAGLATSHAAATEVASWWSTAGASERRAALASSPEVVGNLEGVPYQVRDVANRRVLSAAIADIESRLADGTVGRAASEELQAQLHMLQQVEAAVETGESGIHRSLITFDSADGGRAVIVVGNLTTAEYETLPTPQASA
jgi:hypothetical protein